MKTNNKHKTNIKNKTNINNTQATKYKNIPKFTRDRVDAPGSASTRCCIFSISNPLLDNIETKMEMIIFVYF